MQPSDAQALASDDLEGIQERLLELERAQIREDQRLSSARKIIQELEETRRSRDQKKSALQKLAREIAKNDGQSQELTKQLETERSRIAQTMASREEALDKLKQALPTSASELNSQDQIGTFLTECRERAQTHTTRARALERTKAEQLQFTEAVKALFRGFNRWLDEDWGCNYKDRIFGAPYIALADVDFACEELEWALGQGARVVVMRPAAVHTAIPVAEEDSELGAYRLRPQGLLAILSGLDLVPSGALQESTSGYPCNGRRCLDMHQWRVRRLHNDRSRR